MAGTWILFFRDDKHAMGVIKLYDKKKGTKKKEIRRKKIARRVTVPIIRSCRLLTIYNVMIRRYRLLNVTIQTRRVFADSNYSAAETHGKTLTVAIRQIFRVLYCEATLRRFTHL